LQAVTSNSCSNFMLILPLSAGLVPWLFLFAFSFSTVLSCLPLLHAMHTFTSFPCAHFIHMVYCIFHAAQVTSFELCPCFRLRAKRREMMETEHHTVIRFLRKHSRIGNTTPEQKSWRCCWQLSIWQTVMLWSLYGAR
jgi:hypothetical protein